MSDTMTVGGSSSEMVDELDADELALFNDAPSEPAAPEPAAPDATTSTTEPTEVDEPGDEVVEVENKGRFVRHAALHEERLRRKELQKQLGEQQMQFGQARENQARLDERLRLLNEALSGGAPEPGAQQGQPRQGMPVPEEDPFAFMRHLANRIDQVNESSQAANQRFQEQDVYSQVKQAFTSDAQAYETRQPDFRDAYRHLMSSRDRELQLIGYQDPAERSRVIANEEMMIVSQALQAGKSPAELVYALSSDRGYRRAEQPQPAAAAPAAPAPAPATAQTATQRVQQVKQASAANKSLGSVGGGNTPVLTAESLANMSEAEFEKIYNSLPKADRRALFGG